MVIVVASAAMVAVLEVTTGLTVRLELQLPHYRLVVTTALSGPALVVKLKK